MLITIAEKNWKPKSQDKAIRGEGVSQPQRLGSAIIYPRLRDIQLDEEIVRYSVEMRRA